MPAADSGEWSTPSLTEHHATEPDVPPSFEPTRRRSDLQVPPELVDSPWAPAAEPEPVPEQAPPVVAEPTVAASAEPAEPPEPPELTPPPEPTPPSEPTPSDEDHDVIARMPAFDLNAPRRPIRIDEDDAEDEPIPFPQPFAAAPPAPAQPFSTEPPAPPQPFAAEVPAAQQTGEACPPPPGAAESDIELTTVVHRPTPADATQAQRPPRLPEWNPAESPQQYPIPPAAYAVEDPTGTVPTWAFRAATQAVAPSQTFVDDLSIDPMSLRRRVKLRSGASALVVDESKLVLRSWWRSSEIPWPAVQGFEARIEEGSGAGRLVALTGNGPVELPATKRPLADLRYVHALLDAYRIRAQLMANR